MEDRCRYFCSVLLVTVSLACGSGDAGSGASSSEAIPAASEAVASVARGSAAVGQAKGAPTLHGVQLSPDPPASEGSVRAVVRAQNDGGSSYALHYTWEVAGHRIDDELGAITLPKLRKGDQVRVSVVASNAAGSSMPLSAETTIPNSPPMIFELKVRESEPGEAEDGEDGELWVAEAWARDPDGDPIEFDYTWILDGEETDQRTARFATQDLKRGDRLRVRVVASDGEDESSPVESGTIEVANASPDITSTPPGLDPSGVFHYQLEAHDADGDRHLRYELVKGPRGMAIDAQTGALVWKPGVDQAGRHPVEIAVDDRQGGRATQAFVIPIVVSEVSEESSPAAVP